MPTPTNDDEGLGRELKLEVDCSHPQIFMWAMTCSLCRRELPCTQEINDGEQKVILHGRECRCVPHGERRIAVSAVNLMGSGRAERMGSAWKH